MNELLTKDQWNVKFDDFNERYPWITYQKNIISSPGWLNIIDLCLSDLSEIMRSAGLENVLFFDIYVRDGRDKSLGIYAEFSSNIGKSLIDLCNDRIKDTTQISSDVCRKCGAYIVGEEVENRFFRGSAVCKAHNEFDGVFAEEFNEWNDISLKALSEQARIESEENDIELNNAVDITSVDEIDPEVDVPVNTNPSSKLYDLEELKASITDKSNDRNVNQKRKEIGKKMELLGEMRFFCDVPDAGQMANKLRAAFPNFSEVINFIETYVMLANTTGKLRLPPILLEGPAGIGKTAFTSELSKLLNTFYLEIHMENEQSNSTLAGSSEFWANSQIGAIFEALVFGKTCNPLIVVDEVDKASRNRDYNPLSPLYQLLERDTAKQFRDLGYRSVAIDASNVLWILTANDTSSIDQPILSRMRRFNIEAPTQTQAELIAQRIYTSVLARNEWVELFDPELKMESVKKLAGYPPRQMKAEIEAALGKAKMAGRDAVHPCDIGLYAEVAKRGIGFLWQENN